MEKKPIITTGGGGSGGRSLLKVNALKNFETTSLRSFSTANFDTASIKSDISNFTDLGPLDLGLDDDLADEPTSAMRAGGSVMENFLILDRLNKKQQQRREQLRLKRQQQKLDELRQRQHELELKALAQQHIISSANAAASPTANSALTPTGSGAQPFRYGTQPYLHQQQQQQQSSLQNSMLNSAATSPTSATNQPQHQLTGNATATPFQLKYHYQPTTQLVQFNVSNPSRVHMIHSNYNLNQGRHYDSSLSVAAASNSDRYSLWQRC